MPGLWLPFVASETLLGLLAPSIQTGAGFWQGIATIPQGLLRPTIWQRRLQRFTLFFCVSPATSPERDLPRVNFVHQHTQGVHINRTGHAPVPQQLCRTDTCTAAAHMRSRRPLLVRVTAAVCNISRKPNRQKQTAARAAAALPLMHASSHVSTPHVSTHTSGPACFAFACFLHLQPLLLTQDQP
jgi:hypothetical protein